MLCLIICTRTFTYQSTHAIDYKKNSKFFSTFLPQGKKFLSFFFNIYPSGPKQNKFTIISKVIKYKNAIFHSLKNKILSSICSQQLWVGQFQNSKQINFKPDWSNSTTYNTYFLSSEIKLNNSLILHNENWDLPLTKLTMHFEIVPWTLSLWNRLTIL